MGVEERRRDKIRNERRGAMRRVEGKRRDRREEKKSGEERRAEAMGQR
jgi:hypothetical protein